MAEETEKSALEQLAAVLLSHGVEFIVIGGQAEALYGSPRVTYDVDVCYRRTRENLEKLAAALLEIKPGLRGAPPDLPFRIDAAALALGANFTFTTAIADFDLIGYVAPLGEYDAVAKRAMTFKVGDMELKVIDLDDLITIKEHLRRPKDRESLMQLLAIKRERDTRQTPS